MKYSRYLKYRDSGVEWLGEVPGSWDVVRLKQRLVERIEKNVPIKTDTILSLTMTQGVVPLSEKEGPGGNKPKEDLTKYHLAHPGDIVLNSMNVIVGSVGLSKYYGLVSPVYYVLTVRKNDSVFFLNYIFQSRIFQKSLIGLGKGIMIKESETSGNLNTIRMKIPMDNLNNVMLPMPSTDEQEHIVAFLDYETSRIDTLIAEQEKLITLLKEKRQAVISHAVTKGLNPNAPMKDSSVEHLGKVPEEWDVFNFRRIITRIEQGWSPNASSQSCQSEGDWGVLKISAVKFGRFIQDENKALLEDVLPMEAYRVVPGDLLLTRANTPDLVGDCCVVSDELCYYLMMSDLIYRIQLISDANTYYLSYFLRSNFGRSQIKADARGSSMTMAKISQEHIKDWVVAMPSLDEQQAIVNYLDIETRKIDILVVEAQKAIDLLYERRTALISAAVTGKIDVRSIASADGVAPVVVVPPFGRWVFAAEIIDKMYDLPEFGHVFFQKCLYVAQYHLRIGGFEECYFRKTAGPYDNRLIHSVDSQLEKSQWFKLERNTEPFSYSRLAKCGKHKSYFDGYYGAVADDFYRLLDLFRLMGKRYRAEIIATLYAVWNDFLIQGEAISDDRIINEVLTNWHESKTKYNWDTWQAALDWMREKGLVPSGFGKATIIPSKKGKS